MILNSCYLLMQIDGSVLSSVICTVSVRTDQHRVYVRVDWTKSEASVSELSKKDLVMSFINIMTYVLCISIF